MRATVAMVQFGGLAWQERVASSGGGDRLLAEKPFPDKMTLASQMPSSLFSEGLKFQ